MTYIPFRPTNQVFVATNGSDTTGNGSFIAPYQTISHALSTITDSSSGKRYAIIIQSGQYNETSLAIKPYVSLWGTGYNNCRITVVGNQVTLDGGWSGTSGRSGFFNLIFTGTTGLQFDFSGLAAGSAVIDIWNTWINGAVNIIGRTGLTDFVQSYVSSYFGAVTYSSMNIVSDSDIYNSTYTISTASAGGNTAGQTQGSQFVGAINISNTSTNTTTYTIGTASTLSTITVNGAHTTLNIDVPSYVIPTIQNSATVNLISISNGISANFSPANYTAADASVHGNLSGIDTQIPKILTIVPVTSVTTSTYTTLSTDYTLACNRAGSISITLIASPANGRTYHILDSGGNALLNNITITPASGNINGASNFVLNMNFASVRLVYTGTQWNTY